MRRRDQPEKGVAAARQERVVGGKDLSTWYTPFGRRLAALAERIGAWSDPHATLVLTLLVGMVAVVALSAAAAQVYEAVTESDSVAGLDEPMLDAAISIRAPWLNVAATAFTDLGGGHHHADHRDRR